jgi:hypothetical protein
MTSYQEITRKVGDQWVAALKTAEDSIVKLAEDLDDARGKVERQEQTAAPGSPARAHYRGRGP